MNCSPELIEVYADQELDAAQQAAVEQHLATCAACSDSLARLRRLKADIRASAGYHKATPDLRQAVLRALEREAAPSKRISESSDTWRWLAVAAAVLLALSLAWNSYLLRPHTAQAELAQNILSDHVRSLIGTHLVDVPSSDQHTVKPWFAGKLAFSPDVRDLSAQGFPLEGGRLEYLNGQRVAALVYHRRLHVINLFIWAGASGSDSRLTRDGYNLLHWSDGSMTYWAVSDVSMPELENLRALYR